MRKILFKPPGMAIIVALLVLASARLIGESVYLDSMIACVSAVLLAGSAVYVSKRGLSIGNRTQALMLR